MIELVEKVTAFAPNSWQKPFLGEVVNREYHPHEIILVMDGEKCMGQINNRHWAIVCDKDPDQNDDSVVLGYFENIEAAREKYPNLEDISF